MGCSVQKGTNYSNLNREQVRKIGTGNSYKLAAKCLTKLGYKLISKNNFRTDNGNALVDFQKKNNLAYGALDEATLYLLIQKSKEKK